MSAVAAYNKPICTIPDKIPGLEMHSRGRVHYFVNHELGQLLTVSDKNLPKYELDVVDGKIVVGKKKKVLDTSRFCVLYTMHPDRKIYAEYHMHDMVHHTSLAGVLHKPIVVGQMKVLKGRLTYIDEWSDQYGPSNRTRIVLEVLRQKGAPIDPVLVLSAPRLSETVVFPAIPKAKKEEKKAPAPAVKMLEGPAHLKFV